MTEAMKHVKALKTDRPSDVTLIAALNIAETKMRKAGKLFSADLTADIRQGMKVQPSLWRNFAGQQIERAAGL